MKQYAIIKECCRDMLFYKFNNCNTHIYEVVNCGVDLEIVNTRELEYEKRCSNTYFLRKEELYVSSDREELEKIIEKRK